MARHYAGAVLLGVSMLASAMAFAAACETEPSSYSYADYGEDRGYTAGYDHGRETGYEDGYSDGYDEGQSDLLDCARSLSMSLYYGGDEYDAVPIEDLDGCQ